MPWIKIKNQLGIKTFICEYESREGARKDKLALNESIFEVRNTDEYIKQIQDWNDSQSIIKSGKTQGLKKEISGANINPNKISESSAKAIRKALKTQNENDWLILYELHNKEKWSNKEYCCEGQLDFLKWQIQKLIIDGWK